MSRDNIIKNDIENYSNLGSLTQTGYIHSKTQQNIYSVDIYYDKHSNNQTIAKIYMIDSGQLDCNGGWDHFGCIQHGQIEWYSKQDHSIPGIIYMHIPTQQLMSIYNDKRYPSIGQFGGNLNCVDQTNMKQNFIDYILKNDDIIAMFHGHEHQHDSITLYEHDLLIGFGRKSGEGWMIGVDIDFAKTSGARIFEFDCNNPKLWNTWITNKYLNVMDKTSFKEMNKQKQNLSKIYKESECVIEEEQKCLSAHHYKIWKPSVIQKFKHWMCPYLIDIVDIMCRFSIPRIINDYFYDLGMDSKGQSIRSGFD